MLNLLLSVFSTLVRWESRSADLRDRAATATPSSSLSGLDAGTEMLGEPGAAAAFGLLLVAGWALQHVHENKSSDLVILDLNDSREEAAAEQIVGREPR